MYCPHFLKDLSSIRYIPSPRSTANTRDEKHENPHKDGSSTGLRTGLLTNISTESCCYRNLPSRSTHRCTQRLFNCELSNHIPIKYGRAHRMTSKKQHVFVVKPRINLLKRKIFGAVHKETDFHRTHLREIWIRDVYRTLSTFSALGSNRTQRHFICTPTDTTCCNDLEVFCSVCWVKPGNGHVDQTTLCNISARHCS